MDPITLALLGGTVANVGSGLLGEYLSQEDQDAYERLMQSAASEYGRLTAPELRALQAEQLGPSAMEGLGRDQGNRSARDAAIQALMREGLSGGDSLESRVAQAQGMRAGGQMARAGSEAALASAARRGQGGAAATLQAQLLGASMGADRAAQTGMQGAMDARRSALQALAQGGGMAGSAEEADTAREIARRTSMDRIAQFNASQRAETARHNTGLEQQRFGNQQTLADRRATGTQTLAQLRKEKADRTRGMVRGIGQGVGQGFAGYGMYGGGGSGGNVRQATAFEAANPGAIGSNAALSQDELQKWRRGY